MPGYKIGPDDSLDTFSFDGLSMNDVGYQLVGMIQEIKPDEWFTAGIRRHLESICKGKASLVEY